MLIPPLIVRFPLIETSFINSAVPVTNIRFLRVASLSTNNRCLIFASLFTNKRVVVTALFTSKLELVNMFPPTTRLLFIVTSAAKLLIPAIAEAGIDSLG